MIKRWLIFPPIFLLLSVVVLHVLLQGGLFSKQITALLLPSLSRVIDREVTISRATISLLPPSLIIHNLRVEGRGRQNTRLFLQIKRIDIFPSLKTALVLRPAIRKIRIEAPSAHLFFSSLHETETTIQPVSSLLPVKSEKEPFALLRTVVEVVDGRMQVEDQETGNLIETTGIAARISPDVSMNRYRSSLDVKDITVFSPPSSRRKGSLSGIVFFSPHDVTIDRLLIKTRASFLRLSGDISHFEEPRVRLLFTSTVALYEWQEILPWKRALGGTATVSGEIVGSEDGVDSEGVITVRHFSIDGHEWGDLSSPFSFHQNRLFFPDLAAHLFRGEASGQAEISFPGGPPVYSLSLTFSHIMTDGLSYLFPGGSPIAEKALSGRLEISGERFHLKNVNLHATTSSSSIHLEGGEGPSGHTVLSLLIQNQDIREITAIFGPSSLEGRLHIEATATLHHGGDISSAIVKGKVAVEDMRWRGRPLGSFTSDLFYTGNRLEFSHALLSSRSSLYKARGFISFPLSADPSLSITAEVRKGDPNNVIALFYRELPISASADGIITIKGLLHNLTTSYDLRVTKGSVYGVEFERGHITMILTRDRIGFKKVILRSENGTIQGEGEILFSHRFTADLTASRFPLHNINFFKAQVPSFSGIFSGTLRGGGDFQDPQVTARVVVHQATIDRSHYGESVWTGEIKHAVMRLRGSSRPGGHLSFSGGGEIGLQRGAPFKATLAFHDLPVTPFLQHFFPASPSEFSSQTTGTVIISGKIGDLKSLSVKGRFPAMSLNLAGYQITNEGDLQIEVRGTTFYFPSFRLKGDQTFLTLSGSFITKEEYNLFLSGEAGLGLFRLVSPDVDYGKGVLYLAVKVSGHWTNPKIRGGLTVQNGVVRSKTFEQPLTITSFSLFFDEQQILLESLEGSVGQGVVKIKGRVDTRGFSLNRYSLLTEITQMPFHLKEGLSAIIDGSLLLQGTQDLKTLKGELVLQKASYEKRVELKKWLLELSRLRQRVEKKEKIPFIGEMLLNVHLVGNKNIWFNNNLGRIPLEVDLFLKGTVNSPVILGRIQAKSGSLFFRRNDFTVLSGSLDFFDPEKTVPFLDFKAKTAVRKYNVFERTSQSYEIVVGLSGTGEKFDLSLSSDPPLSETDILGLLTVGKTAEEISQSSKEVGAAEATSLLVEEIVGEQIKELTGVNRFQVDPYYSSTRATSGPRLTVEKRVLNDRLSIIYSYVIDPSEDQLIKLEYSFTRNVSLVGEKDELGRVGGEIKFRFEFK